MGHVDDDGILDLIVGAGKDHALEVVVYAGAPIRGKGTFGTELARFQPFDSQARGGVSVAAAQIDGTNADNIIVGSGPGVPSQVKVYQIPLALSSSAGPALFATFKPYGEDRSGVTVATGFVDFSTGRESIVAAPGTGRPTEVKVFAVPLLKPIAKVDAKAGAKADHGGLHAMDEAVNTASFTPFGKDYRGGVSLATGWLAGSLGGAKRIVVSKLADGGSVKIFSSGSALDGGPSLYLQSPEHHGHGAQFREIASFEPFGGPGGTRVATTSTTTGANLLVSGAGPGSADASVIKYDFVRPNAQATTLEALRLGQVWSGKGSPPGLGGD